MLELLILVAGIVAIWKFRGSTSAVAVGAETKTEVWAEKVIADATIERAENYKAFQERVSDGPDEITIGAGSSRPGSWRILDMVFCP